MKGQERRRPRQVGDVVRAELARLVSTELRDPAIGFATITAVEMSPDLRLAKVHVSVFGDPERFSATVAALNAAGHRLRGMVGRNCGLRHAPELRFVEDHTVERGARIEALLRTLPPEGGGSGEPGDKE